MSILDPLRTPRASRPRAMAFAVALLFAVALVAAGLAGVAGGLPLLAAGGAVVAATFAATYLFLWRQSRLRALLPHANETLRRVDVARLVGAAVAVVVDGRSESLSDPQDRALLRRQVPRLGAHWAGLSDRWLRPVVRGGATAAEGPEAAEARPVRPATFDPALVDFIREPARTALDASAWDVFLRDLCDVTTSVRDAATLPRITARVAEMFADTLRPAAADAEVREGRARPGALELIVLAGLLRGATAAARAARPRSAAGFGALLNAIRTRGEALIEHLSPHDARELAATVKALREAVEAARPLAGDTTDADQNAVVPPSGGATERVPAGVEPADVADVVADGHTGEYFVVPELGVADAARAGSPAAAAGRRAVAARPPVPASQVAPQFDERFEALRARLRQVAARREDYSRTIPGFDLTAARDEATLALDALIADAQRGDADARAAVVVGEPSAAGSYLLRRRDAKVEQLRALYAEILDDNSKLAAVSLVLGNLDVAQASLEQVINGRPDDLDALLRLAQVRHLQGQLDDAERLARRVLDAAGEEDEARRGAALAQLGQAARSRGDLDRAEDEFRKALMIAERAGSRDGVAAGYCNLGLLHLQRGDSDRAAEMFRGAAAASEAAGPLRVRAVACGQLGLIHRAKGDVARAEQMLRASADAYAAIDMPSAAAGHLNTLGLIFKQRGDLERAESAYRHAVSLNERAGARDGLATNFGNLADVAMARGEAAEAEALLRRAIELFEQAGSRDGVAIAYSKLGPVLHANGSTDAAIDVLQIALAIHEKVGNRERIAENHANLGLLYADRGDLRLAEQSHGQALALQEELHQPRAVAATLNHLGRLAERLNEQDKAEAHYRRALALHERVDFGDNAEPARLLTNLGNLLLARGHAKPAEELLSRAMGMHEQLGSLQGLAATSGSLAGIYQQRGDLGRAEEMIRVAIDAMSKLGAEEGLALAHVRLGAIFRSRGDLPSAAEMYREAISIDARRGAEAEVAANCGNLGLIYRSIGNLEQAEEMLRRALVIFEKLGRADSLAVTYAHLGTLAMERGHAPNARDLWSKALELYQQLGKQDTVRSLRGRLESIGSAL